MIAEESIEKEIWAQKRVVLSLKREIFGIDYTSNSKYIKDFKSEFGHYERVCSLEDVIKEVVQSDIAYFGDFHPLLRDHHGADLKEAEMCPTGSPRAGECHGELDLDRRTQLLFA